MEWIDTVITQLSSRSGENTARPQVPVVPTAQLDGTSLSLHPSSSVGFFILREKWDEAPFSFGMENSARTLCRGQWMIRFQHGEEKIYFCGSDEVWNKLEGKNRFWITDLLAFLWNGTVKKGLDKKLFWHTSIYHLLKLNISQKALGGTFA